MDRWFKLATCHGTELQVDLETGSACSVEPSSVGGRYRGLLAWQPASRCPYIFLTPNESQPALCCIAPDPFVSLVVPLRAARHPTDDYLALFHPGVRRYVSAAPPVPGEPVGAVTADRQRVKDWEKFRPVPVSPDQLPAPVIARIATLEHLLALCSGATVTADAILVFLEREPLENIAVALNATLPITPLAELQRFAEFICDKPSVCAVLARAMPADVFAAVGLQELSHWLTQRDAAAPRAPRLSLGSELDYLADLGFHGVPITFGHACNGLARASVKPRRDICVVATARNEGLYLLEWIAYHRAIGVEAFFVYSNDNDDGSDGLLGALADAGIITWISNEVAAGSSAQNKAYGHALGLLPYVLDYAWALFIDLDEFFVFDPALFSSICEFLGYHELQHTDAIAANWVFIGSSGQNVWSNEPVTRRFTRQLHGGVYPAVKSICRPAQFLHSAPHFPRTHNRRSFVFRNAAGDLHSYAKATIGPELAPATSDNPDPVFACVYHYFFKSAEELVWKFSRNRGDHPKTDGISNMALEPYMVEEFLEQHEAFDLPTDDRIARCAPNLDAEISTLLALPGVAAAQNDVERIYRERIVVIKEAFRDARAIQQLGAKGRHLLRLAGVPGVRTSALDRMTRAELMWHFQSLGDNCEFGIAQRRCGAEPLGLLRFSYVDRQKLLEGLSNGFAGLGEADDIEFQMFGPDGPPKEYMVYERRYTLVYHTWVYENQVTPDEMRAQEQMKLSFLKRKFFEDAEEGNKLWVYKTNEPTAIELIWPLAAALRERGDNTLLWVVPHDPAHPPGSVTWLGEGLLRGHIDRFAPYEEATDVSVSGWVSVCRNAYAAWRPEATLVEPALPE
jgi:hypothetical protein